MKYHKTPFVIAAVAVMLVSATLALADYCFEGNGYGTFGEIHPWGNWQGCVKTGGVQYDFEGDWWCGGNTGGIVGTDLTYNGQYGCYYESQGTWTCNEATNLYGYWDGYFCPGSDTADGTWWSISGLECDGTWWGNNAD